MRQRLRWNHGLECVGGRPGQRSNPLAPARARGSKRSLPKVTISKLGPLGAIGGPRGPGPWVGPPRGRGLQTLGWAGFPLAKAAFFFKLSGRGSFNWAPNLGPFGKEHKFPPKGGRGPREKTRGKTRPFGDHFSWGPPRVNPGGQDLRV